MILDPSEVKLIRDLARQDAIEFGEYVAKLHLLEVAQDFPPELNEPDRWETSQGEYYSMWDLYDKFQQEKKEQAKQENK